MLIRQPSKLCLETEGNFTAEGNRPLVMDNRVGRIDITAFTGRVAADLDIARDWKPGSIGSEKKQLLMNHK